jgi:hypothetical protein
MFHPPVRMNFVISTRRCKKQSSSSAPPRNSATEFEPLECRSHEMIQVQKIEEVMCVPEVKRQTIPLERVILLFVMVF